MTWFKSSYSFASQSCVEVSWHKASFSGGNGGGCVEVGWGKSSFSERSGCVEASAVPESYHPVKEGTEVLVRDSKNPDGPVLEFTAAEWDAFLAGVRNGEFDRRQTPVQEELDRLREQTGVQDAAKVFKHATI